VTQTGLRPESTLSVTLGPTSRLAPKVLARPLDAEEARDEKPGHVRPSRPASGQHHVHEKHDEPGVPAGRSIVTSVWEVAAAIEAARGENIYARCARCGREGKLALLGGEVRIIVPEPRRRRRRRRARRGRRS
jgi:hypothetical protein